MRLTTFRERLSRLLVKIRRRAGRAINVYLRALDNYHVQDHIPTGAEVIPGLGT
jgi:hypothetical protein